MIVGGLAYLEGHGSERREHSTYDYAQEAKRNAAVACADSEAAAIANCVYDEIDSAYEESESRQDLDAQQWMARWAAFLTVITLATTAISWIALRYLRDTFLQAKDQVELARRALEIETRPFLYLESIDWKEMQEDDGSILFRFTFNIKNIGKLPATNVRVWTSTKAVPISDRGTTHSFSGKIARIAACPQGVIRKTFDGVQFDAEEVSYFEGMTLGISLGLKIVFDTRFTTDKTVYEYRWADVFGMRELGVIYLDQPALPGSQPDTTDLFDWADFDELDWPDEDEPPEDGEQDANHKPRLL